MLNTKKEQMGKAVVLTAKGSEHQYSDSENHEIPVVGNGHTENGSHMQVAGLDYKDSKWDDQAELTIKLPKSSVNKRVASFGMPVSKRAATKMVKEGYWQPLLDKLDQVRNNKPGDLPADIETEAEKELLDTSLAVTFGKEALLLLLAQPDCEGIRFYFCKNHEGKTSLVLAGVDRHNHDIGGQNGTIITLDNSDSTETNNSNPIAFEVGGTDHLRELIKWLTGGGK